MRSCKLTSWLCKPASWRCRRASRRCRGPAKPLLREMSCCKSFAGSMLGSRRQPGQKTTGIQVIFPGRRAGPWPIVLIGGSGLLASESCGESLSSPYRDDGCVVSIKAGRWAPSGHVPETLSVPPQRRIEPATGSEANGERSDRCVTDPVSRVTLHCPSALRPAKRRRPYGHISQNGI